jgi:hypothetical protein
LEVVSELIGVSVVKPAFGIVNIVFVVVDVWIALYCEVGVLCEEVPVPG